ncbi:MAG: PIN domain-containing protein [Coriobacteriales bacterium]|nr:PIN domain-containing protein [Coriobacteriales bacterium]
MSTMLLVMGRFVMSDQINLTNTVLFDTNVWLDYFLNRNDMSQTIVELIAEIDASGCTVATTVSIKKDVFYLVPRELQRIASASNEPLSFNTTQTSAYTEIAWAVLEQMDNLSTIVPLNLREDFFARHLRAQHADYEDDALLATARSIGAQCVVTSDKKLLECFSDICCTPHAALNRYKS